MILTVVDLIMPVMDGVEATEKIRQIEEDRKRQTRRPSPDCIVIALTASTLSSDYDRAMKSGCNDFLQKPVSLRWLEKVRVFVKVLLRYRKYVSGDLFKQ